MRTLEPDPWRAVAVEHVDRVDEADLLGAVGHHQRMGPRSATEEANALQQIAGGHAGGGEDEILARCEVLGPIDTLLITMAHPGSTLAFVVAAIAEARL